MEWCWRLVSLPSAPMSSESVLSLTPVQKVAPYCLVPSTASSQVQDMAHFCPSFCGLCLQNPDPESLGTGISPWLVHTTGKPFPDPMNCLPSTNPDPLVCPYPSWVHSESVCVMLQKGDQYQTCRKPSHKTREQNDVNTALFLFEPLQRSQLSHVTKGEIAETQPERRKPFKLQCLNAFLL